MIFKNLRDSFFKKFFLGIFLFVIVFGGIKAQDVLAYRPGALPGESSTLSGANGINVSDKTQQALLDLANAGQESNWATNFFNRAKELADRYGFSGILSSAVEEIAGITAKDLATRIAWSGTGQKQKFFLEDWEVYLKNVGDDVLGAFVQNLGESWIDNFNMCEPNFDLKVKIGIGLLRDAEREKPDCSFTQMYSNWERAVTSANFLNDFNSVFEPEKNDLGQFYLIKDKLTEEEEEAEKAAEKNREEGDGWNEFGDTISELRESIPGVLETFISNTDLAGQMRAIKDIPDPVQKTMDAFLAHLKNELFRRIMYEIGKDGETITGGTEIDTSWLSYSSDPSASNPGEATGGNQGLLKKIVQPNFRQVADYGVLSELSQCPDPQEAGPTNCVLEDRFRDAISKEITVRQAIEDGYLNAKAIFGFQSNGLEPNWYDGDLPYRSMIILRKYRVLPVGWENAAQYIKDHPELGQVRLEDMIDCFDGTDDTWCSNKVDPSWVLKMPEHYCNRMGPGPEILYSQITGSNQNAKVTISRNENYCADEMSLIREDSSGRTYGYCTEERRTWNFPGDSCEAEYNTCQTFAEPDGSKVSYLANTLLYDEYHPDFECSAEVAGCRAYAEALDFDPATFSFLLAGPNQEKFYDSDMQDCSQEGEGCTRFIREDGTQAFLKKAPDYLDCPGDGVVCANFLSTCEGEGGDDNDCEYYETKDGDIIYGQDPQYCEADCSGYDDFVREAYPHFYFTASNGFDSFRSDTAERCSLQAVGCSEFTNLDETEASGAEKVEYFAKLTACELLHNDKDNLDKISDKCKTFYTWQSSEDSGYSLEVLRLSADKDGNPRYRNGEPITLDPDNLSSCEFGLEPNNPNYDPDCIEIIYFPTGGGQDTLHVRKSDLVYCSDDCVNYRMSGTALNNNIDEDLYGDDGQYPIYKGIPDHPGSLKCSEAEVGCREYSGNFAADRKIIFSDDFESGSLDPWSGGIEYSNESESGAGHSMYVNTAETFVSAKRPLTVMDKDSNLLIQMKYKTSPAAGLGGGMTFISVNGEEETQEMLFLSSESLWDVVEVNISLLGSNIGKAEDVKFLEIRTGAGVYFDYIRVVETTDINYFIKDSWDAVENCNGEDLAGDVENNMPNADFDNLTQDQVNQLCGYIYNINSVSYDVCSGQTCQDNCDALYSDCISGCSGDVECEESCAGERDICKADCGYNSYVIDCIADCPSSAECEAECNGDPFCEAECNNCIADCGNWLGCDEYIGEDGKVIYAIGFEDTCSAEDMEKDNCEQMDYYDVKTGDLEEGKYFVYDPAKSCSSADEGCLRYGLVEKYKDDNGNGVGGFDRAYTEVFKIYDVGIKDQIECSAVEEGCESYDNGNYLFKNPFKMTCEFRDGISGEKWYRTDVKKCGANIKRCEGLTSGSICSNSSDCAPGQSCYFTYDGDFCLTNKDCSAGEECSLIDNVDYGCLINSEFSIKTVGRGGDGDYIEQPATDFNGIYNWVGLCPSDNAGCTEYIDPYSSISAVSNFAEPYTLYVNDSGVTPGTCGNLEIGGLTNNNPNLFFSDEDGCAVQGIRKAIVEYRLENEVEKEPGNFVDIDSGLILFNERSLNSSGLYKGLGWNAEASYVSGNAVSAVLPAVDDSNTVLQVKPDRECGSWLACKSYVRDDKNDTKICMDIGVCESLNSLGECDNFATPDPTNEVYDLNKLDNSGYSKVAYAGTSPNAYYPVGAMSQEGNMVKVPNGEFEFQGGNGYPVSWNFSESSSSWTFDKFGVIDSPVVAQEMGSCFRKDNSDNCQLYWPEGSGFLSYAPASGQIESDLFELEPDADYYVSAFVNTKDYRAEDNTSTDFILEIQSFSESGEEGTNFVSLNSGSDWTYLNFKFNSGNGDRAKIYLRQSPGDKVTGNVYVDKIAIRPVLNYKDNGNNPAREMYLNQSCRLYPQNEALSCEYRNQSGAKEKGLWGYCLEYDRYPGSQENCLMWYPVDRVNGDAIDEGAGYSGRYPLYYSVESEGGGSVKFDIFVDDDITLWVNGSEKLSDWNGNSNEHILNVNMNPGSNVISLKADDHDDENSIKITMTANFFEEPIKLSTDYSRLNDWSCIGSSFDAESNSSDWKIDPEYNENGWLNFEPGDGKFETDVWCPGTINSHFYARLVIDIPLDSTKIFQTVSSIGESKYWSGRVYEGSDYDIKCNESLSAEFLKDCFYDTDASPFGSIMPPGVGGDDFNMVFNPYEWDASDEDGIQPLPYISPEDLDGNPARMGQLHSKENLQKIFAQSYGVWNWDGNRYVPGDESENWTPPDQKVPAEVCADAVVGKDTRGFCGVAPEFNGSIKLNGVPAVLPGGIPGVAIATSTVYMNLTFNSVVDSQQLPLVMFAVDWGEGEKTVVSGIEMRDRPNPDNPHSLYHLYSYWDLKTKDTPDPNDDEVIVCHTDGGGQYCQTQVRVKLKDNWGWYSGTEANGYWVDGPAVKVYKE